MLYPLIQLTLYKLTPPRQPLLSIVYAPIDCKWTWPMPTVHSIDPRNDAPLRIASKIQKIVTLNMPRERSEPLADYWQWSMLACLCNDPWLYLLCTTSCTLQSREWGGGGGGGGRLNPGDLSLKQLPGFSILKIAKYSCLFEMSLYSIESKFLKWSQLY